MELGTVLEIYLGLATVIGTFILLGHASTLLRMLARHSKPTPTDFYKKYGDKDSYCVITGGSDGIGLEIAKRMIKQGFNICVVGIHIWEGTNEEKLQEIRDCCPPDQKLKVIDVEADFNKMKDIAAYEKIAEKLKDLDIAMLFLNAGAVPGNRNITKGDPLPAVPMSEYPAQEIEDSLTINCLQPVYLAKVLLDQLRRRKQRTAVIVSSSVAGLFPVPGWASYCAHKVFISHWTCALSYEEQDKMDWITYNPSFIVTPLTRRKKPWSILSKTKYADGYVNTVEQTVNALLRDIGSLRLTLGSGRHEIEVWSTSNFKPFWYLWPYDLKKRVVKVKKEMERRKAKGIKDNEIGYNDPDSFTRS